MVARLKIDKPTFYIITTNPVLETIIYYANLLAVLSWIIASWHPSIIAYMHNIFHCHICVYLKSIIRCYYITPSQLLQLLTILPTAIPLSVHRLWPFHGDKYPRRRCLSLLSPLQQRFGKVERPARNKPVPRCVHLFCFLG